MQASTFGSYPDVESNTDGKVHFRRANPTDSRVLGSFHQDRESITDGDGPNPAASEQRGTLNVPEEGRPGGNVEIV